MRLCITSPPGISLISKCLPQLPQKPCITSVPHPLHNHYSTQWHAHLAPQKAVHLSRTPSPAFPPSQASSPPKKLQPIVCKSTPLGKIAAQWQLSYLFGPDEKAGAAKRGRRSLPFDDISRWISKDYYWIDREDEREVHILLSLCYGITLFPHPRERMESGLVLVPAVGKFNLLERDEVGII